MSQGERLSAQMESKAQSKKEKRDQRQHRHREELDPAQRRAAATAALIELSIPAQILCRVAGVPSKIGDGQRLLVAVDQCWCPDSYRIATDDLANPDGRRMRIQSDHVYCPIHKNKFGIHQLLDKLPLGTRKSTAKKDELLGKINLIFGPLRFYCFQSGVGFGMTGLSADPREALSEVQVSFKVDLRGVLIECFDLPRAHEILETMSDDLPWKDLAEDVRPDLSLNAGWHNCELTPQEKLALHSQQLETAVAARKARMRLINQMRSDADRLMLEKF